MKNEIFDLGLRWRSSLRIGIYVVAVATLAAVATWSSAAVLSTVLETTEAYIGPRQAIVEAKLVPVEAPPSPPVAGNDTATDPHRPFQSQHAAPTPPRLLKVYTPAPPRREDGEDRDDDNDRPKLVATFCVRLCDGFYWPISTATTPATFDRDRGVCERACPGAPARLFVNPVPGGLPDHMQDLSGQPYAQLKTAFRFHTTYDAACRCAAQPWEQQAQDRHRVYALEAAQRKGDVKASTELTALRAKVDADRRTLAGRSKTITEKLVAENVLTPSGALVRGPNAAFGTQMGLGLKTPEENKSDSAPSRGPRNWVERAFTGN